MSVQIGQKAPEFQLPSVVDGGKFKDIKSSDYKGKWIVLFFYPLDFTFVCPTEITSFTKHKAEIEKLNAEIVGVSVDSVFSHQAWLKELGDLNYPLASDITKDLSRDYGVLMEDKGISLRGTFIIDPEGILRYQLVHDLGIGREVSEIIRVLAALQTGELCQASWKPGEKTLGKA